MNIKDIDHNELVKRAYNNAVKHGWHDTERNNSHWVMMIISEMAEAIQADRRGLHAHTSAFQHDIDKYQSHVSSESSFLQYINDSFQAYVKDTVEDEFADIVIRSYDFAGVRNIDLNMLFGDARTTNVYDKFLDGIIAFELTDFLFFITSLFNKAGLYGNFIYLVQALYLINEYARRHGFDLYYFVKLKMKYNETRPYKHNLKY